MRNKSGNSTLNMHVKYWESIDEMPMYHWQKCSDGFLKYVNVNLIDDETGNQIQYDKLYDQYLARFGLSKQFERYMKLLQQKAKLQCLYVQTNKRFKLTEIEIVDAKIERLNVNFGDGKSIETTCLHLSKWLGYKVNLKETTVVEYYTIIQEYGKWANKKE